MGCEDKKADSVNFDGTYKLSEGSMNCDGMTNIAYFTIDGTSLVVWDYDGDECDDVEDCYGKQTITATQDGDSLTFKQTGPDFGSPNEEDEISGTITRHRTNGLKVELLIKEDGQTITESEIWDFESAEINTYSPVCSEN